MDRHSSIAQVFRGHTQNALSYLTIISDRRLSIIFLGHHRSQLITVLGVIIANDFPTQYPALPGQIQALLQAQDPKVVHVGLLALKELTRAYKYVEHLPPPVLVWLFPGILTANPPILLLSNIFGNLQIQGNGPRTCGRHYCRLLPCHSPDWY